jgi:hypothetical protein
LVLHILLEHFESYTTSGSNKVTSIPKSALMLAPTLSTVAIEKELGRHSLEPCNYRRQGCCWWAFDKQVDVFDRRITFVIRLLMVKKLTAVRIKEQDLRKLEEIAVKEDETVSSLVRQAIKEFLNRRSK